MTYWGGCSVANLPKFAGKSFASATHQKTLAADSVLRWATLTKASGRIIMQSAHRIAMPKKTRRATFHAFGPISIFARRRIESAAVFSGSAPHALHSQ